MIGLFRRSALRDQADDLRELARDASAPPATDGYNGPPMIVVAGSKGGVGATSLTLELAKALAAQGVRCVAVDANLRQADLGQLAGAPVGGQTIADVLAERVTAADALLHVDPRLWLLAGAWAPDTHQQATADGARRLLSQLGGLAGRLDAVVVDAGSGHTPASAPLWESAATALLVATPEKLSLLGAYAAIKLSRAGGASPDLGLLVNRVSGDADASQVHAQVGGTSQRFLGSGVKSAGAINEGALDAGAARIATQLTARLRLLPEEAVAA